MIKLIVSGKPTPLRMLTAPTANGCTAVFELKEPRFEAGARFEVVWECFVPAHKVKWCSNVTSRPYTIVVEADQFSILGDDGSGKGVTRHMLKVSEVNAL